jgi:hypothetical protein
MRRHIHAYFVVLANHAIHVAKYLPVGLIRFLVLTTFVGRPRRADSENGLKNNQGPTTSRENVIQNT